MAVTDISGASFDFERVLSSTRGLVGRNFVPFFALSCFFNGLVYASPQILEPSPSDQDPVSAGLFAVGSLIFVMGMLMALQGTLTRASVDALSGGKVSLSAALMAGLVAMLPLLGLGILVGLGIMAGAVLLLVPGIMLAVRWSVAGPVLVIERAGVLAAMGRSAALTKDHRWAVFGVTLILVIFPLAVWAVFGTIIGGGAFAFTDPEILQSMGPLLLGLTTIISAVMSMVSTVLLCATYFELRQIKEGVGIDEIASVFD